MGLFDFLRTKSKGTKPFSGGSGASMDDAVVITASSHISGVSAQHDYVRQQCGREDEDWTMVSQALIEGAGGKPYDLLTVKLRDGTTREFYFDISSFYGKF